MKLLSATVRNYRVHEDVTVDFHEQLSVIGGANEAGKSTLMEAIHRALFVPAKGQQEVHRNMSRAGATDKPAVELAFEHQGRVYDLHKVFGGNSGYSVTLRERGQTGLTDEEAESKLREITGAEVPRGKRLSEDIARKPWSHLWVWQGASGAAPTEFIEGTTEQLVNLTSQGAGSVLMSGLDSRLAAKFRAEHEAAFTKANKPKAGTAHAQALEGRGTCQERVAQLRERVGRLEGAARQHAEAKRRLAGTKPKLDEAREGLKQVESDLATAENKRLELERDEQAARQLDGDVRRLAEDAAKLKTWDATMARTRERLDGDDRAAEHSRATAAAESDVQARQGDVKRLRERLPAIAAQQAGAEAYVASFRAQHRLASAKTDHARIERLRDEREVVRAKLQQLPEVTSAQADALRERSQQHAVAEAQLNATASTLTFVAGAGGLTVDGDRIAPGETRHLTQESTLRYGDDLELRLTVPDNADWTARRQHLTEQREALRAEIARHLVDGQPAADVDALAAAARQREALLEEDKRAQRLIAEEQPDSVLQALQQAEREAAETSARIAQVATIEVPPADLEAATALAQDLAQQYTDRDTAVSAAAEALQRADTLLKSARDREAAYAKTRRADEDEFKLAEALRQNLLAGFGGSAEAFGQALSAREAERDAAERKLARTREAFVALEVDLLQTRRERLQAQVRRYGQDIQHANDQQQQALGQMQPDGEADPFTELREAEEQLATTEAECARHARESGASALLHELFKAELDAANERVTQPLAERVELYLRHVHRGAKIQLRYRDSAFTEFYLYRPELNPEPEAFSALSGGAREQVAAAVRLATAEILAEDYGGTLPVVFDDAFVNSDRQRVSQVVDMLFYAAQTRGLQIIIGTCDPERYGGIGKVEYQLRRGAGAHRV